MARAWMASTITVAFVSQVSCYGFSCYGVSYYGCCGFRTGFHSRKKYGTHTQWCYVTLYQIRIIWKQAFSVDESSREALTQGIACGGGFFGGASFSSHNNFRLRDFLLKMGSKSFPKYRFERLSIRTSFRRLHLAPILKFASHYPLCRSKIFVCVCFC